MKLPVAILAGGLATRLHPITETIPKALVDVAGTPFVLRQLDYLRRQGVGRVVLCVGFLGEQIQAVVGDGSASGLSVSYSQDWPNLMGTGGALKQVRCRASEAELRHPVSAAKPLFRAWECPPRVPAFPG